MAERIRHFSVYIANKKVATMTQSTYDVNSNDESQVADGGYFGHSDGAETTTLSVDTIEPVRKSDSATIRKALRAKSYVKVTASLISGSIETVEMRCVKASYSSDATNGKLTGKFDFEGGAAEIQG
jgi:hypothetical protein